MGRVRTRVFLGWRTHRVRRQRLPSAWNRSHRTSEARACGRGPSGKLWVGEKFTSKIIRLGNDLGRVRGDEGVIRDLLGFWPELLGN